MKYFTSDLHIGEFRVGDNNYPSALYRPFMTINEQNNDIISKLNIISPFDELYVLGDVLHDIKYEKCLERLPKCKKRILIEGNHDENKLDVLSKYFDDVIDDLEFKLENFNVFLNHYPKNCISKIINNPEIDFAITGHIHGLWKVSHKMINVSTDAWYFFPVSEKEILFTYNAMLNYYDENVYPWIKT